MGSKKKAGAKVETVPKPDENASAAVKVGARAVADAVAANPPATEEEKAAFAAEKERREKRVIEANERAMRDGQVAETKDGKTGVAHTKDGVVIFITGQFAYVPLSKIPSWYLGNLMGDGAPVEFKWRSLTKEQQTEVKKEMDSRASASNIDHSIFPAGQGAGGAVSDLESKQEQRAKEASPIPVGSGPQAPTVAAADSLGKGTGSLGGNALPEVGASRKATDKAIDKAADEGKLPPGNASETGVTGVETGTPAPKPKRTKKAPK